MRAQLKLERLGKSAAFVPEIGDVDEGIVERGEDAGDAEDEFTYVLSVCEGDWIEFGGECLLGLGGQERCSRWRRARPSFWEAC